MKSIAALLIIVLCLISCGQKPVPERGAYAGKNGDTTLVSHSIDLPFVGKRGFETRAGVSGTGTPHRSVEIRKNGDVYFFFEQENQADNTITKERYYAGKFKRYMKCYFKKLDNERTCYEFTKDTIYEVDEHNGRIKSNDCCNNDNVDDKNEFTCKGEFLSIE